MRIFLTALFIVLTSSASLAQAQFTLKSFEQDKLIKSLDEVLYVVLQEYAVRGPDDKLYGNDGNEYFGKAFGPAVMINGMIVMNKYTWFPYLRDTSFKSLGQNYVPEPTKTMFKKVHDSSFTTLDSVSTSLEQNSVQILSGDSPAINHDLNISLRDSMDCVVITFTSTDSLLDKKSSFEYSFINNSVIWDNDGLGTLEEQNLGKDTHFGLLFYEHTGHGQAALIFGGFIEKRKSGEWSVLKARHPAGNSQTAGPGQ